jgi:hypothetical protein
LYSHINKKTKIKKKKKKREGLILGKEGKSVVVVFLWSFLAFQGIYSYVKNSNNCTW